MALAVSAPVACEPLIALVPDQAPEAVQAVALVADQLNMEPLPLATVAGLADKLTAGAGDGPVEGGGGGCSAEFGLEEFGLEEFTTSVPPPHAERADTAKNAVIINRTNIAANSCNFQ